LLFNVKVHKGNNQMIIKDNTIDIFTNKRFINNEANLDVIKQLSRYYKVDQSKIRIVSGLKKHRKVIEIID